MVKDMSRLHEPLKLPKHPKLLECMNNMSIRIKAHHKIDWSKEEPGAEEKLKAGYPAPTYDEILDLLGRAYKAINEQREDPRRY
jgi:hypothetical protein